MSSLKLRRPPPTRPLAYRARRTLTAATSATTTTLHRVRRRLAGQVPGDGRHMGTVLARVHPLPGVPGEIRRLVYTPSGIDSLNARFRQATRRRGHFPNEQAALKILYLTIREKGPNRSNPPGRSTAGSPYSTPWPSLRRPPRADVAMSPYTKNLTDPLISLATSTGMRNQCWPSSYASLVRRELLAAALSGAEHPGRLAGGPVDGVAEDGPLDPLAGVVGEFLEERAPPVAIATEVVLADGGSAESGDGPLTRSRPAQRASRHFALPEPRATRAAWPVECRVAKQ